jgi:hypothetical protein
MLRALIAACAEPFCKCLGAHLPAAPIQEQNNWLRAAFLPSEPVKKSRLGAKRLSIAPRNSNTTLEIVAYQPLVWLLLSRGGSDVGEGYLHGEENTSRAVTRARGHLHQNLKLWTMFWVIHIAIYEKT